MTNLVQFTSPRLVQEQASLWLVRLEEGLSNAERVQLHEWLEADPAHAQALIRMAGVWDSLDVLSELAEIFPLEQYGHQGRGRLTWKAACITLAAVGLASLGGYLLVERGWDGGSERVTVTFPGMGSELGAAQPASEVAAPVERTYRTAVGEQLSTRLPDGSVITLNTDTLLAVDYSAAERLVVLTRGEAIFRVARDGVRPFRVQAGQRVVQALGTVFNIKLGDQDDVEVMVTEGSVRVLDRPAQPNGSERRPPARELTLAAGELAVIRSTSEQVRRVEAAQIEANLAWRHGMLIYQGEPLDAVLADVSRYTTIRFLVPDESLRSRRVGGYFRAGDVDGLLLALRESFGIEPRREGDVVVLTPRN